MCNEQLVANCGQWSAGFYSKVRFINVKFDINADTLIQFSTMLEKYCYLVFSTVVLTLVLVLIILP